MSGRRVQRRRPRHLFSKLMVLYCVAFSSFSSLAALWIAHRDGMEITGLLGVILGLFGGELLLMCLKALLGREPREKGAGTGV